MMEYHDSEPRPMSGLCKWCVALFVTPVIWAVAIGMDAWEWVHGADVE